jgi:uncharacterized membrane protein
MKEPIMAEQKAQPVQKADAKDVEENKVYAILAYLGILVLVPILAAKESRFAQYHANQGLVLLITSIICGFVIWIPVVGWLLGLGILVLWVMGIVNAAQGEMKPLPVIGGFKILK